MLIEIRNTFILLLIIIIFLGFTDLKFNNLFSDDSKTLYNYQLKKTDKDKVVISRVIDGDTVLVINNEGKEERVRLLLIDTPESVHPDKPSEKFGKEASDYAKKVLRQGMKVKLERGDPSKDKYGRTLGYIFVNGVNFNELMVKKGYARVAYVFEPNTKYLDELLKAQEYAKSKKLKIWSIDGYVTENGFDMSVIQ